MPTANTRCGNFIHANSTFAKRFALNLNSLVKWARFSYVVHYIEKCMYEHTIVVFDIDFYFVFRLITHSSFFFFSIPKKCKISSK